MSRVEVMPKFKTDWTVR